MRSTRSPRASADDLTARARIRDAAIHRFGREGFGASLRTIAADAGASPGLVIHHFGSKQRLREECDAHVLAEIRHAKHESIVEARGGRLFEALASVEEYGPTFTYVVRSLQQGGDLAKAFVDHMVADAVEYVGEAVAAGVMVPSRDEEARARYMVLSSLGAALLALAIDPPEDPSDLGAMMRRHFDLIMLPALELYSEGALTTRRMLDDYLDYVGDPPGTTQDDVG